nr:MAG TPA: hypothetical protein [Caudoviricetes sp.]
MPCLCLFLMHKQEKKRLNLSLCAMTVTQLSKARQ